METRVLYPISELTVNKLKKLRAEGERVNLQTKLIIDTILDNSQFADQDVRIENLLENSLELVIQTPDISPAQTELKE